ncbi:MAG: heme exporter protein CcmD [Hydrogenophilus sp.]|nr:heme exporter protein CcmD [Hydrogenophilus sp.]
MWASWTDFWAMGGRGMFVWGSYGVTLLLVGLEVWLLYRAWRRTLAEVVAAAEAEGDEIEISEEEERAKEEERRKEEREGEGGIALVLEGGKEIEKRGAGGEGEVKGGEEEGRARGERENERTP